MEIVHYLPLGWLLVGSFWLVLLKCWIICPTGPTLLGIIFESRIIPWSPKYQFWAFVPGNFFLGLFVATSTRTFGDLPNTGWYHDTWPHAIALVVMFVVYLLLCNLDLASDYTRGQLMGATKPYHNSLYFWYGYVAVECLLAVVAADVPLGYKLLICLPGLVWVGCLVVDAKTSPEKLAPKFRYAHADNFPIWKTILITGIRHFRLRKRSVDAPNGYELMA